MGIRGLIPALRPFGELATLSGRSVVIDGPALVHHVWNNCFPNRLLSSFIIGRDSYSDICHNVLAWLEQLEARNVVVRRIYFDGFLPPTKWAVRQERLVLQTELLQDAVRRLGPSGVGQPPEANFREQAPMEFKGGQSYGGPPRRSIKHPFLVPAVTEALRSTTQWNDLVQIVPGEADAFCSQDVRKNGGVVLTGDSDLLIEDLGPDGSVMFLWDISEALSLDVTTISALQFSAGDLEQRFGIQSPGGMPRLAFLIREHRANLKAALEDLKLTRENDAEVDDRFQVFLEEHVPKHFISEDHPVVPQLSTLDPRISELVIQSLNVEVIDQDAPRKARQARGPEEISMFLPVMIEDVSRKSSWSMSEWIRQLAYGVAQGPRPLRRSHVIEYRRLQSDLGGRQLSVPRATMVESECQQLLTILEAIGGKLSHPGLQWLAFTVWQDIEWSRCEGRQPISVALIGQSVDRQKADEWYSWELIHFTAQIQACLYSLRMLNQVLNIRANLSPDGLPASQETLRGKLSALPQITDYITVIDLPNLLSMLGKSNALSLIAQILGVEEIAVPMTTEAARRYSTKPRLQAPFRRPVSSNPFDLLEEE